MERIPLSGRHAVACVLKWGPRSIWPASYLQPAPGGSLSIWTNWEKFVSERRSKVVSSPVAFVAVQSTSPVPISSEAWRGHRPQDLQVRADAHCFILTLSSSGVLNHAKPSVEDRPSRDFEAHDGHMHHFWDVRHRCDSWEERYGVPRTHSRKTASSDPH